MPFRFMLMQKSFNKKMASSKSKGVRLLGSKIQHSWVGVGQEHHLTCFELNTFVLLRDLEKV